MQMPTKVLPLSFISVPYCANGAHSGGVANSEKQLHALQCRLCIVRCRCSIISRFFSRESFNLTDSTRTLVPGQKCAPFSS